MSFDITEWIIKVPVILFAITVHEYAHGMAAFKKGDPTAKNMGRLTLNPLPHIDPIGAICLFLFSFGWAKPVPINPRYFKDIRKDTIYVSLAGPVSNLLVAFCAGMIYRFLALPPGPFQMLLIYVLILNIGLGLFNLLPLPPLDGSHVLENLLPPAAAQKYREFGRHGFFILLGIIFLDRFAHAGILDFVLFGPLGMLVHLFSGLRM